MRKFLLFALIFSALIVPAYAENIKLPEPNKSGGIPLIDALTQRHTAREFADVDLTLQELSDLLYATGGVNRDNGLRVYPVAMNRQDIFIFVFNREGVYKYDALSNSLELITSGDFRAKTGQPEFVGKAAVNLAYVHDLSLWNDGRTPKEIAEKVGYAHSGALMQNAYLFAANRGWNAVVRMSFDSAELSKLMKLNESQAITLVHSIGPKP